MASVPQPCDDTLSDDAMEAAFREAARRAVAEQLAAGLPVHYSGIGRDANKLYMLLPDGRRLQYRLGADGRPDVIRDVSH